MTELETLRARVEALEAALSAIEDFTNGYGDVAGIACRMAAKALRPDTAPPVTVGAAQDS